jgi:hypothetical protein
VTDTPKNFANPDETLSFPGITEALVEIAGMTVARTVQDPGWRWSTDVQPLVGGEWCEARHVGVMISGRAGFLLRDDRILEFGPDSATVPTLVSGVDLRFEPRGEYELKGFGPRVLFAYAE